jgi:hypothetical protein
MKEKIVPDWILKQMETKYFPFYQGAIIAGSYGIGRLILCHA